MLVLRRGRIIIYVMTQRGSRCTLKILSLFQLRLDNKQGFLLSLLIRFINAKFVLLMWQHNKMCSETDQYLIGCIPLIIYIFWLTKFAKNGVTRVTRMRFTSFQLFIEKFWRIINSSNHGHLKPEDRRYKKPYLVVPVAVHFT